MKDHSVGVALQQLVLLTVMARASALASHTLPT